MDVGVVQPRHGGGRRAGAVVAKTRDLEALDRPGSFVNLDLLGPVMEEVLLSPARGTLRGLVGALHHGVFVLQGCYPSFDRFGNWKKQTGILRRGGPLGNL
jgi:hypothetical protein